ncbi:protein containing Radical SAM [Candidatus Magnetomorum sp. HK-1]|nr:protein containing Radical SAM [Candidatus Magnetomorum sp. HK-1]
MKSSAPFLPTTRKQMKQLGWDQCDIIIVTGDAYVDHPGFGCAIIGRVLESQGFRVGIIPQPDWRNKDAFKILGKPGLFFGVTAGNMDSMVNHYTSERHVRDKDAYSPDGQAGLRPNRASIVYAQKCREAYPGSYIILGGIECGLRRFAHYDFWSDKIRRSILFDAKADLLIYGNAERAIVEMARLLINQQSPQYTKIPGIAFSCSEIPETYQIQEFSDMDRKTLDLKQPSSVIKLSSFEEIKVNPKYLSQATYIAYMATKPGAPSLIQKHDNRFLWVNAPPQPLTTQEMDCIYNLPYARLPHPMYGKSKIPAFEMIKDSITLMRGCFGGCSFCSIAMHEGRIIQSRSVESVIKEVKAIKKQSPKFSGYISDLGGPTANMYMMGCGQLEKYLECPRLSCLYPKICKHLNTDHSPLIDLYRKVNKIPGIKGAWVASGVRYDLALKSSEYIDILARNHVGGYLKIAPEHSEAHCLKLMMKPEINTYEIFERQFKKSSQKAGKKQYLIPYMMCAHPGTDHKDMVALAQWLKNKNLKIDQVQIFLPTPLTLSTSMYVSGKHFNNFKKSVSVPKGGRARSIQKMILRYHDKNNWDEIRKILYRLKLSHLIGYGKDCLVPKNIKLLQI